MSASPQGQQARSREHKPNSRPFLATDDLSLELAEFLDLLRSKFLPPLPDFLERLLPIPVPGIYTGDVVLFLVVSVRGKVTSLASFAIGHVTIEVERGTLRSASMNRTKGPHALWSLPNLARLVISFSAGPRTSVFSQCVMSAEHPAIHAREGHQHECNESLELYTQG